VFSVSPSRYIRTRPIEVLRSSSSLVKVFQFVVRMPKLNKDKDQVEAKNVLQDLPSLSDTEESDDGTREDEQVDEDEINKELVTWAGRLELESIDLREKSKTLVSRMTQNTETIKNTSIELKNDFNSWKTTSKDSLENAVSTFSKSTKSLLAATKVFSTLKEKETEPPAELSKILDILQATKSSVDIMKQNSTENTKSNSGKSSAEQINTTVSKKLQTIINGITKLNHRYDNVEVNQKQNNKSLQTLNDTVLKCLKRIEDVQNLQIDFGRDVHTLSKSQSILSSDFQKLKSDLLINNNIHHSGDNQLIQFTPNSSFNDSMGSFTNNHNGIISVNHQSASQFRSPLTEIESNLQPVMTNDNSKPVPSFKRKRGRPVGYKKPTTKSPESTTRKYTRTRSKCTNVQYDKFQLDNKLPSSNPKRKKIINSSQPPLTSNIIKPSPTNIKSQSESIISLLSDDINADQLQVSSEL